MLIEVSTRFTSTDQEYSTIIQEFSYKQLETYQIISREHVANLESLTLTVVSVRQECYMDILNGIQCTYRAIYTTTKQFKSESDKHSARQ